MSKQKYFARSETKQRAKSQYTMKTDISHVNTSVTERKVTKYEDYVKTRKGSEFTEMFNVKQLHKAAITQSDKQVQYSRLKRLFATIEEPVHQVDPSAKKQKSRQDDFKYDKPSYVREIERDYSQKIEFVNQYNDKWTRNYYDDDFKYSVTEDCHSSIDQHVVLQEDTPLSLDANQNQIVYFKIETDLKKFPLYLRVVCPREKVEVFVSQNYKYPNYKRKDNKYLINEDQYIKIKQRMYSATHAYFTIRFQNPVRATIKAWFTIETIKDIKEASRKEKQGMEDNKKKINLTLFEVDVMEARKKRREELMKKNNYIDSNIRQIVNFKETSCERQKNKIHLNTERQASVKLKHQFIQEQQWSYKMGRYLQRHEAKQFSTHSKSNLKLWVQVIHFLQFLEKVQKRKSSFSFIVTFKPKTIPEKMFSNYKQKVGQVGGNVGVRALIDSKQVVAMLAGKVKERVKRQAEEAVTEFFEAFQLLQFTFLFEKKSQQFYRSVVRVQRFFRGSVNLDINSISSMMKSMLQKIKEDDDYSQEQNSKSNYIRYLDRFIQRQIAFVYYTEVMRDYVLQFHEYYVNNTWDPNQAKKQKADIFNLIGRIKEQLRKEAILKRRISTPGVVRKSHDEIVYERLERKRQSLMSMEFGMEQGGEEQQEVKPERKRSSQQWGNKKAPVLKLFSKQSLLRELLSSKLEQIKKTYLDKEATRRKYLM